MNRLLAVIVLLAACVNPDHTMNTSTDIPPEASHSLSYLALGDSYTIGESVAESERWPEQLAAVLRRDGMTVDKPEIIARTGWTTDELEGAIEERNPQGPYDLVTLLIGVNNQYRGRSLEEYRTQFQRLLTRAVRLAAGRPSHVVVVSIPDWGVTPFAEGRDRAKIGREIDAFNTAARNLTVTAGAAFVDITPISRRAASERNLVASDGLHPSGEMYRLWIPLIEPAARAALGSR